MTNYELEQGGSLGLARLGNVAPQEEEMGEYAPDYDPEMMAMRLAKARGLQQERPQLAGGGTRRERAVSGIINAGRGISDWLGAGEGRAQEKSAMADMLAYREITTNYRKELGGKIKKEFDKLYDGEPDNDEGAIRNLRKMFYTGKLSFYNDPKMLGVLNDMDKRVDKFIEVKMQEREQAFKEQPKQKGQENLKEDIIRRYNKWQYQLQKGSITPEQLKTVSSYPSEQELALVGLKPETQIKPEATLTQRITQVKNAIDFIAPYDSFRNKRHIPDPKKDPKGAQRYEKLVNEYNTLLDRMATEPGGEAVIEQPSPVGLRGSEAPPTPEGAPDYSGMSDEEVVQEMMRQAQAQGQKQ